MPHGLIRGLAAAVVAGAALLGGGTAWAADEPTSEDCLGCHADRDLRRSTPARGRPDSLFVDHETLKTSAHGQLDCTVCHTTATAPHEALPRVRCTDCHAEAQAALDQGAHGARQARAKAPAVTCASCHGGPHAVKAAGVLPLDVCAVCHRTQVALYRESVHGQSRGRGDTEAATCRSCHGATHGLLAKTDPQAPTYHLNLPRTCAACHADPGLAKRHNITVGNVYQLYMDSIHGRAVGKSGLLVAANCSDCHGAHAIKPRTDPTSRVFRRNVPATCATCHAGVEKQYALSIHGRAVARGDPLAPVCTDCHSAHQIRRTEATPWQLEIVRECGTCHAESLKTYRDTFHGKVTALGFTRVARCSDCHGAHLVLPARDPASTVNPANRVATCARCHPSANVNFAMYDPHADIDNPSRNRILWATAVFMRWLLIGTFSFFGLHTGLWGIRTLIGRKRHD